MRRLSPSGARERTRPTASTWPCTTWPPSGSPTRSAGSRLIASPGWSAPRPVRASVSGTTSKARLPALLSTTVRQTPATETESPTAELAAVSVPLTTSREPSKAATVPTSRTIPVNMRQRLRLAQVRLQEDVLARGLGMLVEELDRLGELGQRVRPVSREHWRDEQEQLVDEACREERGGEGRPALEQERLDAFGRERAQLLFERPAAQLELGALRQRPAPEGEPPGLPVGSDVTRVEARRVSPHG